MSVKLVGVAAVIDGAGDLRETDTILEIAARRGLRIRDVQIASMSMGWRTETPRGFVKGACAPIEAIATERDALASGALDLLVVRGTDNARSEYAHRRTERDRLTDVYGPGQTFLSAYTRLGRAFLEHHGISEATFVRCRDALFECHWRTWHARTPSARRPDARWFEPVSELFRGVDCANPSIDFSGCAIVASDRAAAELGHEDAVQVVGAHVEQLGDDGLESIETIAGFPHMATAIRRVTASAGIDLRAQLLAGRALLEVYTCYPIVPIAFLLHAGFVARADDIPAFVERHALTISGGLNLAKAPWNNTTLRALIDMTRELRVRSATKLGAIHSIAGLGYKQAFAVLAAA